MHILKSVFIICLSVAQTCISILKQPASTTGATINLPLDENELIITHPLLTHLGCLTQVGGFKGFLTLQIAQCGQECSTCCLGYSLLKNNYISLPYSFQLLS